VGRSRTKDKSSAELQAERVTAALEEADRTGHSPVHLRDNPGQFLRDMYEVWHHQGGKEGGRWRNSIRKMRDEWLVGRNAVPSLHPKLMGRVKLTRSDARALLDLFLGRWRWANGDAQQSLTTKDGYVGFNTLQQKKLREIVLDDMTKTSAHRGGFHLPPQTDQRESLQETERRWVDIEKVVRECDALITLSRHKIAVGATPWQTIRSVWHMLNHLYEHDERHDFPDRQFIWVIDLGSREVEQPAAFEEYFNAGLLALQLASFANFDTTKDSSLPPIRAFFPRLTISSSVRRDELWRWLVDRAVIVVQNLRLEEFNAFHGDEEERLSAVRLKDIGVTAEHILPSTTPRIWGRELRQLYGKEISASDATFTVFMRETPWSAGENQGSIRYFAHTPLRVPKDKNIPSPTSAEWVTRSVELKAPDTNYDDAFRLLYWSARYRLGEGDQKATDISWEALAYLRKIGFRVLKLPTFLKIFSADG